MISPNKLKPNLNMMRTTLIAFLVFGLAVESYELPSFSKQLIKDRLIESFYMTSMNSSNSLAAKEQFKDNLHLFQIELVKQRNAQCLHDANGFFDWSFIKFQHLSNSTDVLSKETIAMWSNLNVNDTKSIDIIVDNLNKMVKKV